MNHHEPAKPANFLSDRVIARLSWLFAPEEAGHEIDAPQTEVGFALGDAVVGGRFRIGEKLSSGGMGTVYRALDMETGEEVALKVPHFADPRNDVRFELESRALATLVATGLVGYIGHGSGPEPFLAMPLVQGDSLARRLTKGGFPEREALSVMRRVVSGVMALHVSGWVHRDIKPGNILLAEDGTVKLIDLGLAREIEGAGSGTKTGDLVGTLSYMAPEQIGGQRVVDARADVFALGCVLFECLAGKNAFRRTTALIAQRMISGEQEPQPDPRAAGISEPLCRLIESMISPDQQKRPADALEVMTALNTIEGHADLVPHGPHGHSKELRLTLGRLLTGNVRLASPKSARTIEFAVGAASLLAELIAPADVLVLRADPGYSSQAGAHAAAIADCLTMIGQRGLAMRLLGRVLGRRPAPDGEPSLVLCIEGLEWLDEASARVIEDLAGEGRIRIIATTLDGSSRFDWPLVWLGEANPHVSHVPAEEALPSFPFERWVLRAGAMFGRRFTTEGAAELIGGEEGKLVAGTLFSLARSGYVARLDHLAPWNFRSLELLRKLRSELRPSDLRIGEAVAQKHRRAHREPGGPTCSVAIRTSLRCLSNSVSPS